MPTGSTVFPRAAVELSWADVVARVPGARVVGATTAEELRQRLRPDAYDVLLERGDDTVRISAVGLFDDDPRGEVTLDDAGLADRHGLGRIRELVLAGAPFFEVYGGGALARDVVRALVGHVDGVVVDEARYFGCGAILLPDDLEP